jgi:hypothetical protein
VVAAIVWPGICDAFLFPYNRKVWAYDPSALNVQWMGERVATVNLPRILENIALETRRCELGTEFDVSIPAARRHRRDLAIRAATAPAAHLHFDRAWRASTARKHRSKPGRANRSTTTR